MTAWSTSALRQARATAADGPGQRGPQVSGAPRSPVRPVQESGHAIAIEPGGAGVGAGRVSHGL